MNKLRAVSLPLLAWLLAVTTTECRAAATVTYTVTDLGAGALLDSHGLYQTPYQAPYAGSYAVAPQVDDTGAVHYTTGRFDAGSYHLQGEAFAFYTPSITKSGAFFAALDSSALDPTYRWSYGGGINASGAAVGFGGPDTGGYSAIRQAFVYSPPGGQGTAGLAPGISVIPGAYPGTTAWYAEGINATGTIVGVTAPKEVTYTTYRFDEGRAFSSDGKTTLDLNTLIAPGSGMLLIAATSINDLGQIAGWAIAENDEKSGYHAFLLTPTATPEPAPWMLAVGGIGYLGLVRLRSHWRAEKKSAGA